MKQASVKMPVIEVTIATAVELGSISTMNELPVVKTTLTSALTGLNTDLYFYVALGTQPIDNFNDKFIIANLAKKIAEAIRERDLLSDGIRSKIYQKIDEKHMFMAEEMRRNLPFGSSEMSCDPEFYLWIATEGQMLAKQLLSAARGLIKKQPANLVMFAIDNMDDGAELGSVGLTVPTGRVIQGELYLGAHPEKVDEKVDAGLRFMVLDMMKEMVGLKKHPYPVVFKRDTKQLGEFAAVTQTFTAILNFPFPNAGAWFKEDALAILLNDAIDISLKQTVDVFGLLAFAKQ